MLQAILQINFLFFSSVENHSNSFVTDGEQAVPKAVILEFIGFILQ